MSCKELIQRLLKGETLQTPEEISELENFDPDALQSELADLKSCHARLVRNEKIRRIAENSGCIDADYLDFRAEKAGIDLDDQVAVKSFVAQVVSTNPGCFKARIQPGGCKPQTPPAGEKNSSPDRITQLINFLNNAPEVQ